MISQRMALLRRIARTLFAASIALAARAESDAITAAEPIRLSAPLVAGGSVNVIAPAVQFSPDGRHVLYIADQDTAGVDELFIVSSGGGTPLKLNGPLAAGGEVSLSSLQFSPDGGRVMYRADADTDEEYELYTVTPWGTSHLRINDPLVEDGDVAVGLFSPDSSRVVYAADHEIDGVYEIYSSLSNGNLPVKLNGGLPVGGSVESFSSSLRISPDSSRVTYIADQNRVDVFELFSVPLTGGTPVRLNDTLVAGGDVLSGSGRFSPDGASVLYRADQRADEVSELFLVPSEGGLPQRLSGNLVSDGDVLTFARFSPDGRRVMYIADQDVDAKFELYSVSTAGGAPVKLNDSLGDGGHVGSLSTTDGGGGENPVFSPDGSRVLYRARREADGLFEVFSVPATGGAVTKLNGTLAPGGEGVDNHLYFSPDGSLVLYVAEQDTAGIVELYSIRSVGGPTTKLNGSLTLGGSVNAASARFSPDGERVLYAADQDTADMAEIYIVPSQGGTPVKLNAPLASGGNARNAQFSPDGSRVVFLADNDADGTSELYARVVRERFAAGGGSWDEGGNWSEGLAPDEAMQVAIDTPALVTVSGGSAPRVVNELTLGGGSGSSVVELTDRAAVTALHGVSMASGAVLRGDGTLDAGGYAVLLSTGGEVRADSGEKLRVTTPSFFNQGSVQVIGTSAAPAEIEFSGVFTNGTDTGLVAASNALLRFDDGADNRGALAVTFGTTHVFGDVTNEASGQITVSGGAQVTFFDDVANNGAINVGAAGDVKCTAVFFGGLTGNGVSGGGNVFVEGDLRPGFSPGEMSFGGDVSFGPLSSLDVEIGGLEAGAKHDQITVAGKAALGGALVVSLVNLGDSFVPSVGDQFAVATYGSRVGEFGTTNLPPLTQAGAFWMVDYGDATLTLSVSGLQGDMNLDGTVNRTDAALFAQHYGRPTGSTWTTGDFNFDGATTLADLAMLQSRFGQIATPASSAAAVPEPSSLCLLLCGMSAAAFTRTHCGRRVALQCRATG